MTRELRSGADAAVGWALGGLFALVFALVMGHIAVRLFSRAPPGVGDVAPSFSLTSPIDGAQISNDELRGRVLLLDFWGTTCIGCIGATPKLNRLQERFAARGFTVIGLNQPPDGAEEVRRFAEERAITYPIAMDSGQVAEAFGVWALPTVVLIGSDGRIRAKHRGAVTEELLMKQIEAALQGRTVSYNSPRL